MANLATLKAALNAAIYQNNQNAITGEALNTILNSIIDTLGTGYRYAGVATPSANPGTIDNRVFYFATAAGTYTNFGAAQLDGKFLHVFIYDTTWHDIALDVPTTAAIPVIAGSGANSVQGKGGGLSAEASGSSCFGVANNGSIISTGTGGHAEGYAEADTSEELVSQIIASGAGSHAEGASFGEEGNPARIEASTYGAHAEGEVEYGSILSEGDGSHAEGYALSGTIQASGRGSHAEGQAENSIILSSGDGSHAEGYAENKENIQATGSGSHAEGCTSANGAISASGDGAHAEGSGTTASGKCSHAEGAANTAGGDSSHAEGHHNTTQNPGEHAEGCWNKSNKKTTGTAAEQAAGTTLSSVGCGTGDTDRKNAVEVMQNGDLYVKNIGGYDGTNPDSAVCLVPTVMAIEEGDVTESQFTDEDVVPSLTASDVALLRQTPFLKAKDVSGNDISGLFLQIPTALYPIIQEPLPTRIDDFLSTYSYMGFDKIAAIFINSENAEIDIKDPVYSGRYIVVLRSVTYQGTKYYCAYV